ncbi:LCP family protein [Paenibacillus sp. GCM10027628]|uniref:LCP family protein n=1 Tax=Paenibacillus sp. GCM10027628 TaxID=3273413 RepID=UPI00363AAF96
MKRWIVYTAGAVIAGMVLIGGYYYWSLEPKRHFEQNVTPVLVTPNSDTVPIPTLPVSTVDPSPTPSEQVDSERKNMKSFNVLILGIDARADEDSRTDVIMVVHVVPSEKKANIISLPRDTRVNISGVGYTKINHAHILGEAKNGNHGGTEESLQVVSNFLDVPINYYMKTNFVGFENFIDTIGGVDVLVENDIHLRHSDKDLLHGMQHIDGNIALSLVRERWAFPEGDFGRQKEQSKILKSVAKELLAPDHFVKTVSLLPNFRKDIVDTNFTDSDLLSLIRMFQGMSEDDFQYVQIPGQSGYAMDPLVNLRLYYWFPDTDKVKSLSNQYLK